MATLPPPAAAFVPAPFAMTLVLESTANVTSAPSAVIVKELPETLLTVPVLLRVGGAGVLIEPPPAPADETASTRDAYSVEPFSR